MPKLVEVLLAAAPRGYVSARKAVIGSYIEGFRRGDHAQVLGCLAEDIVWELYGHKTVRGKAAFAAEIQNDMFEGEPTLQIDRMVEEGDTVAVTGGGSVRKKTGEEMQFVFSELFTFDANLVKRLETWHIWLGNT